MDPQDIRHAVEVLVARVHLERDGDGGCRCWFEDVDASQMESLGIAPEVIARLDGAPWWPEMLADVAETPEFCEPDTGSEQVLEYARDVVREYVAKRF